MKKKLATSLLLLLALIGLNQAPAYAAADISWATGTAGDGHILGAINMTSVTDGKPCEAITEPSSPSTVIAGLLDCTANGVNVAAVVNRTGYFNYTHCRGFLVSGSFQWAYCDPSQQVPQLP